MVSRIFLTKCNTIYSGSKENFGLNTHVSLNMGLTDSRFLVMFDKSDIEDILDNENFPQVGKTTYRLKMFNCGSVDPRSFHNVIPSHDINGIKERATSFTLIAFRVPLEWDRGVGFDSNSDIFYAGRKVVSEQGCNWFSPMDGYVWPYDGIYPYSYVDGFDIPDISSEYDKFKNGEESIVVAEQHFDYGNEMLDMDITNFVEDLLKGIRTNHGLCICFSPEDVLVDRKDTKYVGFFSDKTNTFFAPYVEVRNNSSIHDNRNNFILGRENKLFLYTNIDGEPIALDELPVCKVDGKEFPVTYYSDGVYFATVKLSSKDYEADMILSDEWSGLKYKGEDLGDTESEFITKKGLSFKPIGADKGEKESFFSPAGLNYGEKINQGDKRKVEVIYRKPYTGIVLTPEKLLSYRIYIHDGNREVDAIDWDNVEVTGYGNFFNINSKYLLPAKYHVDIRYGDRIHKDIVSFIVVNNSTRQKR